MIVVRNGFFAIFVALIFYFILAIAFVFAMIPVTFIVGDEVAQKITNFVGIDLGYKFVYAIVFISMVLDDLGLPNIETFFIWWGRKQRR